MILYYMNVSNLDLNELKENISKEIWDSSKKYLNEIDKILHISGRILLNHILKKIKINNPEFALNKYEKPYLKNYPNIHFNISHSGNYVFCGVSKCLIGVDIEQIHKVDLDIAKNCFHKKEYDYIIDSTEKNEAFFKTWVLKESYTKMKGLGLHWAFDSFIINIEEMNISSISDEKIKFQLWNIEDNKNKYFLGVCGLEKISELKSIKYEEICEKNK